MKKAKIKTAAKLKSIKSNSLKIKQIPSQKSKPKQKKLSLAKRLVKPLAKKIKVIKLRRRAAPLVRVRKAILPLVAERVSIARETPEEVKFSASQEAIRPRMSPEPVSYYSLPQRYGDNRIILLARDPWWLHSYWDITEQRVNEVMLTAPDNERRNLKWALRVYDVTKVKDFAPENANSFFDLEINFFANSWYVNVNQPERDWCVEIGLKDPSGRFYMVARSNVVKSPYFGISSVVDEEWALPDEDYFKLLGLYDLSGKSSMQIKKKFEEFIRQQMSSPLSSWGISSLSSERARQKDKFFLEVWTELILYGRTEPDAELTVEGKKVNLRSDGTFTLRYALPEGDFKYEVTGVSKNKKHKITKIPAVKRYKKD